MGWVRLMNGMAGAAPGAVFQGLITAPVAVPRMKCTRSFASKFQSVIQARRSLYLVGLHLTVILSVASFTFTL